MSKPQPRKFLLLPRSSERVILPSSSWIWQFRANLGNCGIGLNPCQWPSLNGALLDLGACPQSRPQWPSDFISQSQVQRLYIIGCKTISIYFNTICIKSSRIHHSYSQFNYLIYLNSLKSSLKILGCDRLRFNAYPFSFHELYQFQSAPTEKALALYQHRMETACLYKPTVLHRSSQIFTDLHRSSQIFTVLEQKLVAHLPLSLSNALKARQQRDSLRCRRWSWSVK